MRRGNKIGIPVLAGGILLFLFGIMITNDSNYQIVGIVFILPGLAMSFIGAGIATLGKKETSNF